MNQIEQQRLDLLSFPQLKERGAAIQKIGEAYVLVVPRWNETTGEKFFATAAFGKKELLELRAALKARADALALVESEVAALEGKSA